MSGLVPVALLLASCGAGSDDDVGAQPSAQAVQSPVTSQKQSEADQETSPSVAATPTRTAAPESPEPEPLALSPENVVPSVEVVDVRADEVVDVQSVVPADRPVLLWAWAPHCPACRAEAPGLEAFASAHQDEVTVVGIGTQDDLEYAKGFIRDTGVQTPRMLWDPSFESWAALGITAQPTWILVDGGGAFLAGWVGPLPEEQVLEAARAA